MLDFPELFVPKRIVKGARSTDPVSRHALKFLSRNRRNTIASLAQTGVSKPVLGGGD